METGDYTFTFTAPSFESLELPIAIKPGVTRTLDLLLESEVVEHL